LNGALKALKAPPAIEWNPELSIAVECPRWNWSFSSGQQLELRAFRLPGLKFDYLLRIKATFFGVKMIIKLVLPSKVLLYPLLVE